MSTGFGIEMDVKAFNILSSNIYSDKLLAPIRELSTNAWDANVDNGKNGWEFDVCIPKVATELFYVRDYGLGISKEEMLKEGGIFTTYFKSSKEDGTKTGFMGLGSKSPFAVTSVFHVTSYCEGWERVYELEKATGFPVIKLISEVESAEPTGLKISFRIPAAFLTTFNERATYFYSYWEKAPNFVNNLTLNTFTKSTVSQNLYYRKSANSCTFKVVMGNTPYDVSRNLLPKNFSDTIAFNAYSDLDFCVRVDLGSLDFTTSRETIEGTQKSLNTLKSICDKIILELQTEGKNLTSLFFFDWIEEAERKPEVYIQGTYSALAFTHCVNPWSDGRITIHPNNQNFYHYKKGRNSYSRSKSYAFIYNDKDYSESTEGNKLRTISKQNPDIGYIFVADLEKWEAKGFDKTKAVPMSSIKNVKSTATRTRRKFVKGIQKNKLNTGGYLRDYYTDKVEDGTISTGVKYYIDTPDLNFMYGASMPLIQDFFTINNIADQSTFYIIDPTIFQDHVGNPDWVNVEKLFTNYINTNRTIQATIQKYSDSKYLKTPLIHFDSVCSTFGLWSDDRVEKIKEFKNNLSVSYHLPDRFVLKASNDALEINKLIEELKTFETKVRTRQRNINTSSAAFLRWVTELTEKNELFPWNTK